MHRSARLLLVPVLILGTVAAISAGPEEDPACDMKTVVKGYFCESCETALVAKDLVSDVVYFDCADCGESSREAGDCAWCDKSLEKKTSGKGVCGACLEKPEAAEVCVKTFYLCPDCDATASTAGQCEDCEVVLAEQTSKSVVNYACPECGDVQTKSGKCGDELCGSRGEPLKRACSMSGEFPHGGSK